MWCLNLNSTFLMHFLLTEFPLLLFPYFLVKNLPAYKRCVQIICLAMYYSNNTRNIESLTKALTRLRRLSGSDSCGSENKKVKQK